MDLLYSLFNSDGFDDLILGISILKLDKFEICNNLPIEPFKQVHLVSWF